MGNTVDHERTSTTNTFTTIVVKHHCFFIFVDELLVEHIEQLQKRCFVADLGNFVRLKPTSVSRTTLTPYLEREIL